MSQYLTDNVHPLAPQVTIEQPPSPSAAKPKEI